MRKVVVITGATKGMGAVIFDHLTAAGHVVYGCGRSKDARPRIHQVDLTSPSEVGNWVREIERLEQKVDLLINNAAIIGARGPFESIEPEVWAATFRLNVLALIDVTSSFLPVLMKAKQATVINISSILGRFGRAGWGPYAASKFAVEGLTQVLAQELAGSGIRVLALHPARIATGLRRQAYPDEQVSEESSENLDAVIASLILILDNPQLSISGLTLSANDFVEWFRH